jgi:predicted Fe-Mo cluster-binding NifX family protein
MARAHFFQVATLIDSDTVHFEKREKPHHSQESEHAAHEHTGQGMGSAMFAPIADCQVLISGGMGEAAYEHARSLGLEVILPAEKNIPSALAAYQAGTLISDMRRVHKH